MTTPRTVVEAENRLAVFNANRDRILATIHERIIERYLAAAARAGDSSLEYVLNDIAFSEMRRLEKSPGKRSQRQLQRWRELANHLLCMSQSDKRAELERLVQYYCQDVVGNFNPRVFRFAKGVLTPAVSFLLSPVHDLREGVAALSGVSKRVLIEGELGRIRSACERGTLVFAPTHSSNLDSIVVGLGLVLAQLPPVTYGAGKNLFTNPFISYFMHNLGAYRVDRRLGFGLYKDILKEYSTVLLEHGFHSLFFPGGTRCRSNMIEQHLKLGLLGTAVTAYQNNLRARKARDRIYIVPVTLNYRLVLEAETLIDDYLAETGKSRYIIQDDEFSQLGRILEFARKIMVHESAIIMRFGAPLDPMGHEVDEDGESLDRRGKRVDPASYVRDADGEVVADPQRDAEYTRILGRSLADGYRRETVFLSTHLVARVLMDEVVRKAGTTDIYRLLRLLRAAPAACRVPMERLLAGVDRLRARIDAEPTMGRVLQRIQREPAQAVVDDAMRGLGTYHTRPVALRQGDEAVVDDLKLLFYYQNRLSHIPAEAGEGREARS